MKRFGRIGVFVLMVGAIVGWKFYNKGNDEAAIKSTMKEWVVGAAGYDSDPTYCDALFERFHSDVFEKTYALGGRRRGASFDDDKYISMMTSRMSTQARKDGKPEIATGLEEMSAAYLAAPDD